MFKYLYRDKEFTVNINKKKMKSIVIRIENDGSIRLNCPLNTTQKVIEKVIDEKKEWIYQNVAKKSNVLAKYYLFGMEFDKRIISDPRTMNIKIELNDKNFDVFVNPNIPDDKKDTMIDEKITAFYIENAKKIFLEKVNIYSEILSLKPEKIFLKNQKSRWGSCSTKKNINLNVELVKYPVEAIEYVIVHELCHLKHMNHSKDFWALVHSVMPDYEKRKLILKHPPGHFIQR